MQELKTQWNSGYPALIGDVVIVVIFATIGRTNHNLPVSVGGVAATAWPFLIGLLVGWAATFALYRDKFNAYLVVPTGVIVWLSTLTVGMIVRSLIGEGTAPAFIIVAGTLLALCFMGWRAIAALVRRLRAGSGTSA
ncbi:MAG: DUF3054 domain-containing protein [Rhodococcus sp.]|nr:DUF3054 domain-containing protein [Rhodococcus sp. (in: high G+C Gram-positive bacteria)]